MLIKVYPSLEGIKIVGTPTPNLVVMLLLMFCPGKMSGHLRVLTERGNASNVYQGNR